MKRKNLLLKLWLMLIFAGLFLSPTVFGQSATLTHSYTFEDGTVNDVVGTANGVLQGDATVSNGDLVLTGGFVSLPGKDINVPSYGSITVESVFKQASGLSGNTVVYSFGETNPDVDWMGIDYILWQPTRADDDFSRASISCGNTSDPWATEDGVATDKITDTLTHYAVTVINSTDIKLYLDGQLIGSTPLTGSNSLANVSADTAYIGADVYPGDPHWLGSVEELNIYEGELDATTITQHAKDYLGATFTDATLDTLYANTGVMDPVFDPATDMYNLSVPFGTTSIHVTAMPKVSGASVVMFDGLGNEYTGNDTVSFTGDGIDLEIDVTALDGTTQKAYYLSIFTDNSASAATLSSIDLTAGYLTSEFMPDSTNYTAVLPYGTTTVDVTGVPTWNNATVTGGGTIDVSSGSASTSFTVTSEDGTNTMEYTLDLYVSKVTTDTYYYIQHEASGLVVGESGDTYDLIRLYHPLNDEKSQLFKFVDSGVAGQYFVMNQNNNYLTLSADPTWDMIMTPTLTQDLDSSRFVLDEFEPGRFKIQSVARMSTNNYNMGTNDTNVETGVYSDKWPDNDLAIWNIKAPDEVVDPYDTYLSTLTVNGASLSPSFDPFTTDYHVTIPVGTNSIDITADPRDATAVVTGAGTKDVSDGEGTITITVTATDPSYTRDYVIYYLSDTPLTLTHSYTFADGTAKDVVGDADATVHGGMISKGIYTASANGEYISLPAEQIAINTYPTVTVEAYLQDVDNTTSDANTMISYFGNTVGDFGTDYFFTSLKARAAISCLNPTSPWSAESGVNSVNILDDGLAHHIVSVLNNDSISFYVDGLFAGATQTSDANKIYNLSNALAYLCKSGYVNDQTWRGQILEYNIYSGQMDGQTVASRAYDFPMEDSTTNATLSALMVDGDTINGFVSYNLTYTDTLAEGTTVIPSVTASPSNPIATAEVTDATELPGAATVLVTAEDGVTQNTYTINFVFAASSDASLSDIAVDGTSIDGFDPATMSYDVELAAGTTTVPAVTATATDANATVEVTDATGLPGSTTILVTAEDGVTTNTYTVNFTVASGGSSDATLSDIKVDGTSIDGFDAATVNYNIELPAGTTAVPVVTATATDANATVEVTDATELPGSATILVTAEDGTTTSTYTVNFTVATGVTDMENASIMIYPTVSNRSFTVKTNHKSSIVTVYNMTGKVIKSQSFNTSVNTISIADPGLYIVKVTSNNATKFFRVIKTK